MYRKFVGKAKLFVGSCVCVGLHQLTASVEIIAASSMVLLVAAMVETVLVYQKFSK